MNVFSCSRGQELAEVLKAGHWPDACDPSLRAHTDSCSECSDLVLVTQSLQGERARLIHRASFPSPSLLWWRAQLRRRNEALERLAKPTVVVGKLALFFTLLVAGGLLLTQARGDEWYRWFFELANSNSFHFRSLWVSPAGWSVALTISTVGALAVIGGFVIYLATEKG